MKVRTGNANFVYEIACDQICGKSHFSMRGVIIVEKQQNFDQWLATQKPEYVNTLTPTAPPGADSAAVSGKPVASIN